MQPSQPPDAGQLQQRIQSAAAKFPTIENREFISIEQRIESIKQGTKSSDHGNIR